MDEDSLERSTAYQDIRTVFSSFFRLGFVTDVNNDKRIARVKFEDLGYTSGWLPVLINQDVIHYYPYDEPQWTEYETEWKGSRAGDPDYADHRHKLIIKPYMPKKDDQVACIYEPVRNGRGFILGGIQPWQ